MNNNTISGGEYSINWKGEVYKAGKIIGYCPVSPYGSAGIPPRAEGYGTVAPGKSVNIPMQDEAWFNQEPAEDTKKKKKA
jgi:hypothetical protein